MILTLKTLINEANTFSTLESKKTHPKLLGISDGKAIGTYIEHEFKNYLKRKYEFNVGSSAKGIDFPDPHLNTDLKTTSIKRPQSSSPFKSIDQKIYGLGHNLLLFIYKKQDINNKLLRKELFNNELTIEVKMNYFYDRPFYFIKINDEKKYLLKTNNYISGAKKINGILSPGKNYFRQGSNNFSNNRQNSNNFRKESENDDINSINSSKNNDSLKKVLNSFDGNKTFKNNEFYVQNKKVVFEKIDNYRRQINQAKFILIIKIFLFIIIIAILFLYILNLILQRKYINMIEKILLAFYYNAETKNILLNIYSKLLGQFHDFANLTTKVSSSSYIDSILSYGKELRLYYHDFKKTYIEYNLEMKYSFPIIYQNKKFIKLRGKWREIEYDSEYCSELDFMIHYIFLLEFDNITDIIKDINIFLFYQNKTNREEKISTSFAKLVFYFSTNYEDAYKIIYDDINTEIYSSYNYYSKKGKSINYALEILSSILYLSFFICCFIFLYNSNLIIIENIIFLFLDFSQKQEDKITNTNNINDISGKLLMLRNLLNDFNLENVKIYSDNLDKKNNIGIMNNSETRIEIQNSGTQIDVNTSKEKDIKCINSNSSSQKFLIRSNNKLIVENINNGSKKDESKLNNNSNSTSKILNLKNILNSPSINSSKNIRDKKH